MKRRQKQGNALLAVGYIRVSTSEQRLGPRAQSEQLESWAATQGIQLVALFIDHGVSGATPVAERPALLGALAALQSANAGLLVASKRDRFARAVTVAASIEAEAAKCGATVTTADGASGGSGSGGVLSRGMHDLLAQWERAVISERTTLALAVLRAKGRRIGGIPYGSRLASDGATLEPSPAEQQVLAIVGELASVCSTRQIVAELARRGLKSRSGKDFVQTQIMRMLSARRAA